MEPLNAMRDIRKLESPEKEWERYRRFVFKQTEEMMDMAPVINPTFMEGPKLEMGR